MAELSDRLACEDILKILSNDTRLAVVEQLLAGPKTVGELNEKLQLDKTLLSHHLKTLRVNRVVETTREGKWIRYRLSSLLRAVSKGTGIDLGCCQLVFDREYLNRDLVQLDQ